jgi:2-oxoglutarate dehydrogenase E1 component
MRRNAERTHNMCVVNCSTPAQYFHVLRRQIHRPFAKPLICMAPKYLLHHRACMSDLKDMDQNTFFRRVIVEKGPGDNMASRNYPLVPRHRIRKLVLCSGQMFYDLYHARAARKIDDVTLVRIEQIAPFPFDRIASVLRLYPNAQWCWAQPEPKNMGAWSYVQPRFMTAVRKLCQDASWANITGVVVDSSQQRQTYTKFVDRELQYVGRPVAAAPATGLYRVHVEEQKAILDQVFA